jgi:hypothetical protein
LDHYLMIYEEWFDLFKKKKKKKHQEKIKWCRKKNGWYIGGGDNFKENKCQ